RRGGRLVRIVCGIPQLDEDGSIVDLHDNRGSRRSVAEDANADLDGTTHNLALLLARESHGPESVGVPILRAFGIEGDLARSEHPALDAVKLRDELALT